MEKTTSSPSSSGSDPEISIVPGQTVTFTVEIFNQGEIDAANIVVVDYLPTSLTLSDATGWFTDAALIIPAVVGDTGSVYTSIAGPIAAGDSDTFDIEVLVDGSFTGDATNTAEIVSFTDDAGVDITESDIDSDSDDVNDDTNVDGEINDDGTIDEDDSDPEKIIVGYPTPSIALEKATNGDDADDTDGPILASGDDVTWTYTVTNTGSTALSDVTVEDVPAQTIDCGNGTNIIGLLLPGESVECTASGIADTNGVYENVASVSGTPMWPDFETCGCDPADSDTWPTDSAFFNATGQDDVTDSDPSHYNTPAGSIAGVVFYDTDGDGVQDPGEGPVEGAKIIITGPDGTTYELETGPDGTYDLTELPPGEYIIEITLPDGSVLDLVVVTVPVDGLAQVQTPIQSNDLAFTGSSIQQYVLFALLLMGGGVVLTRIRKSQVL